MYIPPDDPNAPGGLDPSLALKKKGSKVPLIVVGVVVVGAIGFFAFSAMKKQDERKRHAALMEAFQQIEKDDLGKFWSCILGPNVDPAMFPDNLVLSGRITSQFGTDPKNYPRKVREECTQKAIDAKHKVDDLQAPSEYADSLQKYGAALKSMASAFDAWTKVAPQQVQEMEMSKKADAAGAAWHAFESGKPDNQVIAWDNFLRCAVPTVDSMKDGQALVEYLFKQCKDQAYVTSLNEKCGPELLADPPKPPAKSMLSTLKKLAADDRDLHAFDDCMRKGRKGKRRDDLADVGKAWVDWSTARLDVLKIGKEALKE